ncbi:MAG: LytR/AlgR family response regulator transcription factor [Prolixibacteraceae bacterium]
MKKRISIKTKSNIYFVDPGDIVYCQCNYAATTIYLKTDDPITISRGIKEVEALFDDSDFIRPHQSYLVNRNHITLIETVNNYHLILSNQARIPVSTRRRKAMLDRIKFGI